MSLVTTSFSASPCYTQPVFHDALMFALGDNFLKSKPDIKKKEPERIHPEKYIFRI